MQNNSTLLLIDLQNDFCDGGTLAVRESNSVVLAANLLQPCFSRILATKDWHPAGHVSFAENHPHCKPGDTILVKDIPQTLWPIHCVQNTIGAEFHPLLDTRKITQCFYKGSDIGIDSYSAFFDNAKLRQTGLGDYLLTHNISEIYIMGLATDYCVLFSCLDAAFLGFKVNVIIDACRGVNLNPRDVKNAIKRMQEHGIIITTIAQVIAKSSNIRERTLYA